MAATRRIEPVPELPMLILARMRERIRRELLDGAEAIVVGLDGQSGRQPGQTAGGHKVVWYEVEDFQRLLTEQQADTGSEPY